MIIDVNRLIRIMSAESIYTWRHDELLIRVRRFVGGKPGLNADRIALRIDTPVSIVDTSYVAPCFRRPTICEHVNAMTPEVVKVGRLPTTGSDYRSRALIILSLLVQLLMSRDTRASEINVDHYRLKRTFTCAFRYNYYCSTVHSVS